MSRKTVSAVVLALLALSAILWAFDIRPVKAPSTTWTVDDDGPANFHTIQEAVNAASPGDTVYVYNGTYYENVDVNKELSLTGQHRVGTIINGKGAKPVFNLNYVHRVKIVNFTIRNGTYGVRSYVFSHFPEFTGHTIDGNIITDNRYGGIYLWNVGGNLVENNMVAENSLFGIHLYNAGNNTLSNNIVMNNGQGIDFYGNSNDNVLRNNKMSNNKYNFGLILRGDTFDWIYMAKPGIVNDVDTSNTVNGKPIYVWSNRHDERIPEDAGYVWLNDCSNITVENLSLSNNLQGILLVYTNKTQILNNSLTGNAAGIYLCLYSSNSTIIGNTLNDNSKGIYLGEFSRFTTMRSNEINGGDMNFGVPATYFPALKDYSDLTNDVDASNTVDGKPIIYWTNQHDLQVPSNAGYVMLINSTDILIDGLNLSSNVQNILLLASNNTVITNCSISNSIYGIFVKGLFDYDTEKFRVSYNTTIQGNAFIKNGVGMLVLGDSSKVSDNMLVRNPLGMALGTNNSTISENSVFESDMEIDNLGYELYVFSYPESPWEYSVELMSLEIGGIIAGGSNNLLFNNTVMNSLVGISLYYRTRRYFGSNSRIFHNNVINSTGMYQTMDSPVGSNQWDDGYPSGGNYWSDHGGVDLYSGSYQNETGGDGIGDTPYTIFGGTHSFSQDNYPLMEIFGEDTMSPVTFDDYDDSWHDAEFTITLTATDVWSGVSEIYYKINNGTLSKISVDGQPNIVTEGGSNMLEYWSVDKVGNEELPHKILSGIKLDKTGPTGSIKINNEAAYTSSTVVTLTLTASDSGSGVYLVRYSNDGIWDTETWEAAKTMKTWTLTSGDGTKQVYYQIEDNSGLTSTTYQEPIILDTEKPIANAGADQTVNEDTQITLDGSNSSDSIGITSYAWMFTDSTPKTLTDEKPTYTFRTPGIYTIALNVTDGAENWAIDEVVITVLDITNPIANAGQDHTVNIGATVTFDAGGSSDNVGITSYDWDFGDGTTGTGKTTAHIYANPGTYTVTITVKDAANNSATDTLTVTVRSAELPVQLPTEAFPMWIVAAIIAVIGIAVAATLLLRRRK